MVARVRGVARNHLGQLIRVYGRKLIWQIALEGEALGLLQLLTQAKMEGWSRLILETNSRDFFKP